ncbi:uncharacterized protein LOC114743314 [Neltuma alba]|uniref:uncharacterized protein LOC114731515 n=1 Tax=Neltuma alba TaxID=207710 RepID=UPI0010A2AB38|nr:uncharacterized protein LOC114731515 [Prosopis alba]XP_028787347.1 uncharacterized protein LOC114743314 [Prosopis alba]
MKQRKQESDCVESKTKEVVVVPRPPPPPPPPLPKFPVFSRRPRAEESVTKREIAKFWRQKRIEEEDHLLAAIKAAAKLRARNLTEQDYLSFQESLENERAEDDGLEKKSKNDSMDKEVRVGIKDWWTKSNYAYLNQPAIASMEPPKKRASSYIPNCLSYKPRPLYPTSIGVF